MNYSEIGYNNAITNNITSNTIKTYNYIQMADLCEITIKPNGNSPIDFFYEQLKTEISNLIDEKPITLIGEDGVTI